MPAGRTPPAAAPPVRLLGLDTGPAETLLARSLALLDELVERPVPALRWYRADTPALVLGRGQQDPVGAGLVVVRRGSGGGAVLMDADLLSLDVLLPAAHPLAGQDLGRAYLVVGHAWRRAMEDLGVTDLAVHEGAGTARRLGSERERVLASVCFATCGRGEVLAGGRKLVGLAQRRRRAGTLVQCGLLLRWRPAPLLAALGADPDDPEVAAAAVGLADLLAVPPGAAAIVEAVERRMLEAVAGV